MNLKIKDIAELLQVSEKTVYRWIQEKKIPAYRINHQYRFNKLEINDWILKNRLTVSSKVYNLSASRQPVNLFNLIKKGGVFLGVDGHSVTEVIRSACQVIPIPPETDRDTILASLLEREEMMPTAIGRGLAIPHPRNPVLADIENESISIFLLKNAIDYKAIDGESVHTLFIILSANPQRHLEILAKISFLCQRDDFITLLKNRAAPQSILNYIAGIEADWQKKF